MLIKNLGGDLFNGQRGSVYKLVHDSLPVININGRLHKIENERFEIFDINQQKVVASRTQLPIILSYAMTVHRAQGQTIQNVEIDCASFFAPGQLGVAVGRAVSKNGLSVRNFNLNAATLKHPESVYNFYCKQFTLARDDLSCCTKTMFDCSHLHSEHQDQSNSNSDSDTDTMADLPSDYFTMADLPKSMCPFDITEFLNVNSQAKFITILTPELTNSNIFKDHVNYIHFNVDSCLTENPSGNNQFVQAYRSLNDFLIGDEHIDAIKFLFKVKNVTKEQNKFSSKLAFWMMDKKIQTKSLSILSNQPGTSSQTYLSESGSAKLRYIAGVCLYKIRNRLHESVERNIGKTSKSSKLTKTMSYKKERMLKTLSVSEDSVDINDPSLAEIENKQYKSRGLTIVSNEVFEFFKSLHKSVQSVLNTENLHLNLDKIHQACRNAIDSDCNLLSDWISLFVVKETEELEDEIVLVLISEIFQSVTEHFVKLSIVDSLKMFKRSIPRKKKQALRTKIQALGERENKKQKIQETSNTVDVYVCPICDQICAEEPEDEGSASIGCDKCNNWYHYKCVKLRGNELFLKDSASTWFCTTCKRGKGRGKKQKK